MEDEAKFQLIFLDQNVIHHKNYGVNLKILKILGYLNVDVLIENWKNCIQFLIVI